MTKTFPGNSTEHAATNVLQARLPKFVYFANYQKTSADLSIVMIFSSSPQRARQMRYRRWVAAPQARSGDLTGGASA